MVPDAVLTMRAASGLIVKIGFRWALATAAACRKIARTLLTPHPQRPRPEAPPINTLQRTLCKILPRWWFAAIKAESRMWMVRCRCGFTRSLWEAGGIRGKAEGTAHWLTRCPQCGKRSWNTISHTDATERPSHGA